jgi:hypothetical protein
MYAVRTGCGLIHKSPTPKHIPQPNMYKDWTRRQDNENLQSPAYFYFKMIVVLNNLSNKILYPYCHNKTLVLPDGKGHSLKANNEWLYVFTF